ncbi:DUF1705 domain-containing protein [Parabacteroides sp. AM08-6]|nr:DUF1705 domain-containing protein [Parabacteroides sp. AM08-6]
MLKMNDLVCSTNSFVSKIQQLFVKNSVFILLLFFLNFTIGALYTIALETPLFVVIKLPMAFVSIFFISYLIACLREWIPGKFLKQCVTWASLLISALLFITEMFVFFNFKTIFNASTIQIFLETNGREAHEFIQNYLSLEFLGIVLLLVILFYLVFKIRKKIEKGITSLFSFRLSAWMLLLLLIGGGGVFGFAEYRCFFNSLISYRIMSPFQRLVHSYTLVQSDFKAYDELLANLQKDPPQITENASTIQNIVLILGESLSRNHMSLYAYDKPTNPLLTALREKGELIRFNNVVSPSLSTLDVMSRVLTFYDNDSNQEWYKYDILVDVMKEAGYKTFWFSNQESFGIFGNLPAALASRCDYHKFVSVKNMQEQYGDFDENLLPLLDAQMDSLGKKNFMVIHLLGSHFRYINRYPESFNKFSGKDVDLPYNSYKKSLVAEYDNSVLYNDFVINEIINRFKDKEAVVLYFSDHAEEVYDFRDNNSRSAELFSGYMVEIPFLFWTSGIFRENYPEKVSLILSSVNRSYMTDDVIHTILDLADIKTPSFIPAKSVINPAYDENRKRLILGHDYDATENKGVLLND